MYPKSTPDSYDGTRERDGLNHTGPAETCQPPHPEPRTASKRCCKREEHSQDILEDIGLPLFCRNAVPGFKQVLVGLHQKKYLLTDFCPEKSDSSHQRPERGPARLGQRPSDLKRNPRAPAEGPVGADATSWLVSERPNPLPKAQTPTPPWIPYPHSPIASCFWGMYYLHGVCGNPILAILWTLGQADFRKNPRVKWTTGLDRNAEMGGLVGCRCMSAETLKEDATWAIPRTLVTLKGIPLVSQKVALRPHMFHNHLGSS